MKTCDLCGTLVKVVGSVEGTMHYEPSQACYGTEYVEQLKSNAILEESKADDYWRLICEIREGLQELYAMRGEDELINRICSPLIDKTAP